MTLSFDYYDIEVDDAIQGRNPGDVPAGVSRMAVHQHGGLVLPERFRNVDVQVHRRARRAGERRTGRIVSRLSVYTDAQVSYRVPIGDEFFSVALGANNLFGNDPPTCRNSCGVIGMSPVAHDLPGTLTYLKVSYRH